MVACIYRVCVCLEGGRGERGDALQPPCLKGRWVDFPPSLLEGGCVGIFRPEGRWTPLERHFGFQGLRGHPHAKKLALLLLGIHQKGTGGGRIASCS